MIRVQVTERLIVEATEFMNEGRGHSQSRYWTNSTDQNRLVGALGEIALIDYCWSNNLLAYKREGRSSDVQLHSGHTIEVKTQKGSTPPQLNYRVNFAACDRQTESSDFMFFTRVQFVAEKPECVWLLGGCSWDKFWRLADHHKVGDPMMQFHENGDTSPSGRYFSKECYNLSISQLAPPSASLKHFKSLQQKEEAQ